MSNPSVTATIAVNDQASPRLRELVETSQKMSRLANAAFKENMGGNYAASFATANRVAREHLSTLQLIHKAQSAIAATTAGVFGYKAFSAAKQMAANFIPYERGVRYQRAIQNYSNADMALLDRQRVVAAAKYGLTPEDTLHAQQAFVTRNFSAAITEAGTKQAILLSKALHVKAEEAAKIVEGLTFGQGIHLHDPATASREIAKSADIAAIAAKTGSMTPEDLQQFGKFGIGMATAAGISPQQAFAAGMTLKRANVSGDESGVFIRQMSARLLAPTQKAFEALAHMGINYADYAPQGGVSPEAIDASLRRRYGKGLSDAGKASLNEAFSDEARNVLASREGFASAVREAIEKGGEKLSRTDEKHLVDTALRQYDLSKGSLRGGELFDAILSKASPRDMQAIIGDKQGGRAVMLLNALDQYREYLEKLRHGDGYAEKIAQERMEGLAAAVDRLSASMDMASKQIVDANTSWLTPLANSAGKVVSLFTSLSAADKSILSGAAIAASLSGLAAMGSTALAVVGSLTSLATSANVASAALARNAGLNVPGGLPSSAPKAAGKIGTAAGGLSILSRGFGWLALGTVAYEALNLIDHDPQPNPEGPANYARWKADKSARRRPALADFLSAYTGTSAASREPWDQADSTQAYLRQLNLHDGPAEPGGWQDSAVSVKRPAEGAAKWGEVSVTGTVSGSAEVHTNVDVQLNPSPWFESTVRRAETVANMGLSGKLGTTMMGGDNATKAAAPVGTQQ